LLAALDRYAALHASRLLAILEDVGDGLTAIQDFFRTMTQALGGPDGKLGCPVQNATLELALLGALKRAKAAGILGLSGDLEAAANYLFTIGQGMVVTTKWAQDAGAAEATQRFILEQVESWRIVPD
jgi:hypothetical protein